MASSLPLVAILYLRDAPQAEPEALTESEIIGSSATVRSFALPDHPKLADFDPAIFEATAIIIWHSLRVDADFIAKLKQCKAIIRNGVGFDSVDTKAAAARGIPVCNVPDYGTEEVADHALALALCLCRQLFDLDREAKSLGWRILGASRMRRLSHLTFGIVGLGRIGTAAALRAKAFGFRVVYFDPYTSSGTHKALGIEQVSTLEALLRESDVVSIHCPLSDETRGLIGERELGWMKPTAYLVNTARGDIIQKAPLFKALKEGRLAGAGLDVVEDEPLRTQEEAQTPHLIVTCHAAYCSVEGKVEMRSTSARIARAAARGEAIWNRVN